MEQFRENFRADDFKIDPKQMEEFRRQMEQFQKLPQLRPMSLQDSKHLQG